MQQTCEQWIRRIRDPIVKQEIMDQSDYEQYKDRDTDKLEFAITWCTRGAIQTKYHQMEKDGHIQLLDQPVEDSIGALPDKYWIENPAYDGSNKQDKNCEVAVLAKKLVNKRGKGNAPLGSSKYYKWEGEHYTGKWKDSTPSEYILPYETWKAYVLEVTGEKVVGSVVSVLPAKYQVQCGTDLAELRKLLTIVIPKHGMDGGAGNWYIIDNGKVAVRSKQVADTPVIEYTDWKRILEGKSVKEEVPAAKPIQHTYSVGDWVVPIVDVEDYNYGLGAAEGIKQGVAHEVIQVNDKEIVVNPGAMYLYKKDVRPATQEEIDSVNPPKAKPVDKIEVGTWMYILIDRNWAKIGDMGKVAHVTKTGAQCYLTGVGTNPEGSWYFSQGTQECRVATQAEIDAHLAKATQGKKKVSDKAPKIKVGTWVIGKDGFIPTSAKKVNKVSGNIVHYEGTTNDIKYLRIAEPHEIPPTKPTIPEPWSAITTDGVKVYKDAPVWIVGTSNTIVNNFPVFKETYDGHIEAKYKVFSSKEAADRYIAEHTGKKESPVEEYQIGDWVVVTVDKYAPGSNAPGGIGYTYQIGYKKPSANYPGESWYGTQEGCADGVIGSKLRKATKEEIQKVISTNQSQSINQTIKTKSNVNNNEESSSDKDSITGSRYNIRIHTAQSEGYSNGGGKTTPAVYKVKSKVSQK